MRRKRLVTTTGLNAARLYAAGLCAAGLGSLAVAPLACLEDLDEPLVCLPAPQYRGSAAECVATIAEDPNAFDPTSYCTVNPTALSCYRDPSLGCACEGCGDVSPGCHPPPDCPSEVLAAYPTARCIQLTPEDIGPFTTASEQCLCGCESCVLTCDGRGPIWSQFDLRDEDTGANLTPGGLLTIDVQRHLPDAGSAGLFVRARGVTAATGINASPKPPELLGIDDATTEAFSVGFLPTIMSDRFDEQLFPADAPLTWTAAADRPTLFAFSNEAGAFSLYEIDCIVPFVVE